MEKVCIMPWPLTSTSGDRKYTARNDTIMRAEPNSV